MAIAEQLFRGDDSQLAMELAARLSPTSDILSRFNLSAEDFRAKAANPAFKQLYREAKAVWNSDANTKERIRIKSQMLVEDSLLLLYKMVHDADLSANARLDAFGKMAEMADVKPRKEAETGGGNGFHLTLNFGDTPMEITAQALPEEKQIEGEVVNG
jgi:hypothetical protein